MAENVMSYTWSLDDYFTSIALVVGDSGPEKRVALGKDRVGRRLFRGFSNKLIRGSDYLAEMLHVLGIGTSIEDAANVVPMLVERGFEYTGRLGERYAVRFRALPDRDNREYLIKAKRVKDKA